MPSPFPPSGHTRSFSAIFLAALGASFLAACSSTSGTPKGVITVATRDELPIEMFLSQGYCPPVQIRSGTEALVVHEKGHEGESAFVRYQGSITRTARECHVLGPETLAIKVGVAGRLTAGPKGGAGTATLPLRVAVAKQNGGTVLYSEVVNVPVTVSGSPYSADFTQVVENITLQLGEEDRDLIVYVGFDSGPPKPTG